MSESSKNLLPLLLVQNPAPSDEHGQEFQTAKTDLVEAIMSSFRQMLPSNYVAEVKGPFYSIQMQAAAEVLADMQLKAQEVFADRSFDFTRSEYLFQFLGSLVFPDAESDGYPVLEGDLTYRSFLRSMVDLLLKGATLEVQSAGLSLLDPNAVFSILERVSSESEVKRVWDSEKGVWTSQKGSAWDTTHKDQHIFDVLVEVLTEDGRSTFPANPFVLQENVRLVLRALKPAHTLYTYRHLFREVFTPIFSESLSMELDIFEYEDFRSWCCGHEGLSGTEGETPSVRNVFRDLTRDFSRVSPKNILEINSGDNEGSYIVSHVGVWGVDHTDLYTFTSSTSLEGSASFGRGRLMTSIDVSSFVEGDTITFTEGPNADRSYRISRVLSEQSLDLTPSSLFLTQRMPSTETTQEYSVGLGVLGKAKPQTEISEDLKSQIVL